MDELNFTFKMPDDETLAKYISIKGEKGEKGDPTKLSQLDNDTGFVTASTDALTNYYTKTATDSNIATAVTALDDELGVPEGFFTNTDDSESGSGSSIVLSGTARAIIKDFKLYGNTDQDGTPTPDAPVTIQTATGNQVVIISDGSQQSQSYTLPLGEMELCKLGDYQDYIYKSGEKWYKHTAVGKYTFTGNEAMSWDASIPRLYIIQNTLAALGIDCVFPSNNQTATVAVTNKFKAKSFAEVYTNKRGGFAMSASGFNWQFSALDWTTSDEAISDIAGTVVYYPLATATNNEITDVALIAELEKLSMAESYEGQTQIAINGTLSGIASVQLYKNGWNGTVSGINGGLDSKASKAIVKHKPFYFNSVAEMKAYNLNDGDLAVTTGYYSANDGGAAKYAITSEQLTADDAFILELSNGVYAKLVIENSQVNIRQLGARSQDENNVKYDIAPYISKYMATAAMNTTMSDKITLHIPSGVWYSSPVEIVGLGYSIIGDEQFIDKRNRGTIISSLEDEQDYIFKFRNSVNFTLKNICFSTADFTYDQMRNAFITDSTSVKTIGSYCVRFEKMTFGDTDNLYFQHINGQAFEIASSWEIRYRKLFFRQIDSHEGCIMKFAKYVEGASGNGGVNASSFDYMMFEHTLGHLMELESNCKLYNCYFGVINFEDNEIDRVYAVPTEFTYENIPAFEASDPVHWAVFFIGEAETAFATCIINSIQLNNISTFYYTLDGTNYCYDNIFRVIGSDSLFEIIVNNIDSLGIKKDATILYSHDAVHYQSSFILNNISSVYPNNKEFIYDVEGFTYIRNDGRIRAITDNIVPRLTNSATPAYKNVDNRGVGRGNLLKSDRTAKNEVGVCVNLPTYYGAFSFCKASEKLYLNAKIPNGQTAKIFLNSGTQQKVDCVGTGDFQVYEIDLDANNAVGDVIHVALANENTADYCLVDYFIN